MKRKRKPELEELELELELEPELEPPPARFWPPTEEELELERQEIERNKFSTKLCGWLWEILKFLVTLILAIVLCLALVAAVAGFSSFASGVYKFFSDYNKEH